MHRLRNRSSAAVVLLLSAPALAQTSALPAPPFLRPDTFNARPQAAVTLQVDSLEAMKIREAPWPDSIQWLFIRSPGFQENRSAADAPRPIAGERTISLPLEHPGISMIGLDLPARTVDWPLDRFPQVPAGVDRPDGAQGGTVRVRLVQSAKAILRIGDSDADSVGAGKAGQAVEIRTLMDPALTSVGGDILLRAYIDGDAVKNVTISATNAAAGQSQEVKLNKSGAGVLHVTAAGVWRVVFTQARHLEGNPEALWTVYSATLTFSTPGDAPAPGDVPAPAGEGGSTP